MDIFIIIHFHTYKLTTKVEILKWRFPSLKIWTELEGNGNFYKMGNFHFISPTELSVLLV